eukprot:6205083-Pleurochrysis_carterae.AAC.3
MSTYMAQDQLCAGACKNGSCSVDVCTPHDKCAITTCNDQGTSMQNALVNLAEGPRRHSEAYGAHSFQIVTCPWHAISLAAFC